MKELLYIAVAAAKTDDWMLYLSARSRLLISLRLCEKDKIKGGWGKISNRLDRNASIKKNYGVFVCVSLDGSFCKGI